MIAHADGAQAAALVDAGFHNVEFADGTGRVEHGFRRGQDAEHVLRCGERPRSAGSAPRARSSGRSGDRQCWRAPHRERRRAKAQADKARPRSGWTSDSAPPRGDPRAKRRYRQSPCPFQSFSPVCLLPSYPKPFGRKTNLSVYMFIIDYNTDALRGQGKKQNSHDFTAKTA